MLIRAGESSPSSYSCPSLGCHATCIAMVAVGGEGSSEYILWCRYFLKVDIKSLLSFLSFSFSDNSTLINPSNLRFYHAPGLHNPSPSDSQESAWPLNLASRIVPGHWSTPWNHLYQRSNISSRLITDHASVLWWNKCSVAHAGLTAPPATRLRDSEAPRKARPRCFAPRTSKKSTAATSRLTTTLSARGAMNFPFMTWGECLTMMRIGMSLTASGWLKAGRCGIPRLDGDYGTLDGSSNLMILLYVLLSRESGTLVSYLTSHLVFQMISKIQAIALRLYTYLPPTSSSPSMRLSYPLNDTPKMNHCPSNRVKISNRLSAPFLKSNPPPRNPPLSLSSLATHNSELSPLATQVIADPALRHGTPCRLLLF